MASKLTNEGLARQLGWEKSEKKGLWYPSNTEHIDQSDESQYYGEDLPDFLHDANAIIAAVEGCRLLVKVLGVRGQWFIKLGTKADTHGLLIVEAEGCHKIFSTALSRALSAWLKREGGKG